MLLLVFSLFSLLFSVNAQLVTHVDAAFRSGLNRLNIPWPTADPSKALIMTTAEALPSPSSSFFTAQLSDVPGIPTIELVRRLTDFVNDTELPVSLQVWDLSLIPDIFGNVQVERGIANMSVVDISVSVPLAACCIDPSRRFAVSTWYRSDDNDDLESTPMILTQFNEKNIVFRRESPGTVVTIAWQAVSWDSGSAYSVEFDGVSTSSKAFTPSISINPPPSRSSTMVFASYTMSAFTLEQSLWQHEGVPLTFNRQLQGPATRFSIFYVDLNTTVTSGISCTNAGIGAKIAASGVVNDATLTLFHGYRNTFGIPQSVNLNIELADLSFRFALPDSLNYKIIRAQGNVASIICFSLFDLREQLSTSTTTSTSGMIGTSTTTTTTTAVTTTTAAAGTSTPAPTEVGPGETTTIQTFPGNLTLANQSTLVVNIGITPTVVAGTLTIIPGSSLVVNNVGASGDIVVVWANGGIVGTFDAVTATAEDQCSTATIGETSYDAQTLTVSVDVSDSGACPASAGLSGGAIAGIVIGCVVGVALMLAAIIGACLHKRKTRRSLERMQTKISTT